MQLSRLVHVKLAWCAASNMWRAGVKRKVDSHAVRVRTAWFFTIAKVAGVYEVHVGYRYWDQSVFF